ncbi:hypothetical protein [Winogradskyella sp. UBA3174]|uniref:hypothetical protein n=1 Tax=Winogradskyella sp. UBA3174 TaxID=1947785 RepID=UPI0025F7181D|nr:hypothetical protein [Winogradskyella sp. UBA3174]|tara:strand:+ start:21614 stop:21985 length:372 start_codon:yes stop_codon:yes gene_type:complete
MKNLITSLALIVTVLGFSQSKSTNGMVIKEITKVENVSVTVTVDSAEEIESSFRVEDIKEILESSSDNEIVSFKIICNGEKMSSGVKSHVSYKIEGNSNDMETFLFGIEKIRKAAINYYNNKN